MLERDGEHRNTLDLKHGGIAAVVQLARLYCLTHGLAPVNTQTRLVAARNAGAISQESSDNLSDAYEFICYERVRHQGRQIRDGVPPDNYVDPDELSDLDKKHLRDAFAVVRTDAGRPVDHVPAGRAGVTPLFAFGHDRRRRKAAEAAPPGPLRDYLSAPEQDPRTPLADVRLLALDFETTSLDAASGFPLSAGWVPVDGTAVRLGGAGSVGFLPPAVGVGDSAVFHGITDDAASDGLEESQAVEQILTGPHGTGPSRAPRLDRGELPRGGVRRVWGVAVEFPSVDTLEIEHRLVTRGGSEPTPGSLRLGAARERYGLPSYDAHEALTDALACAELYLAQLSVLGRARR